MTSCSDKPRVLFIATDCNPQWHSLPALIAEYFRSLLDEAEVTLVTHIRNKENLTAWLPAEVKVDYLDTEVIARPLYQLAQWITGDPNRSMTLQVALSYPSYLHFEYRVWKKYKNALNSGQFDIVHRASPMSPTLPSPIASKLEIPFVIGPVLGGLPWPKAFKAEMWREGEWMNYFRGLHRITPFYQSTYRHASAILACYPHTVEDIPKTNHARVIEFSEGAIHPQDYPPLEKPVSEKCKILFVGRLVPFKQPALLVQCFAKSEILKRHRLCIVGDGPEAPVLKKLISDNRLEECVELTGALPIDIVKKHMNEANIFALPSIREQGGGVLTMASMSYCPCVVVDYGGPRYRVPEGCGVKIPMGDANHLVQAFTRALEHLVQSPEEVQSMGKAARKFTETYYSWSRKAEKTSEVYDWVLKKSVNKPNYWN